ncbi:cupin domain-containing protein [Conyzicola nivalis]|uniref:(S)-ureidoglycine aminohydrolase cupin domain-containing protein n=1 Tax=Conyzicola nivalis TaxID=1477021 RepID=A0A916SGA6_9MICO|nr:cupin domain-containing protein [Conyzicola nivalis]GGA99376.1 hypothetical protein GCM10010979_12320 [Conyzicola nivalis]
MTAVEGLDPVVALAVDVPLDAVQVDDVLDGEPATGTVVLGEFDGREYGVWEITPGAMSDVENDEFFVVVAGAGSVEFLDDEVVVHLVPGSVMTLSAGARTIWTVTQTLRKVWMAT